jgi:hypothetical protein
MIIGGSTEWGVPLVVAWWTHPFLPRASETPRMRSRTAPMRASGGGSGGSASEVPHLQNAIVNLAIQRAFEEARAKTP